MKNWKWFWLMLGLLCMAIATWQLAMPYEMKVSDPMANLAVDTGIDLLIGLFGLFCVVRFVKVIKAGKRRKRLVDEFWRG